MRARVVSAIGFFDNDLSELQSPSAENRVEPELPLLAVPSNEQSQICSARGYEAEERPQYCRSQRHCCSLVRNDLVTSDTSARRGSTPNQRKCEVENQSGNKEDCPSRGQPSIARHVECPLEVPLEGSRPFPLCEGWQNPNDRSYQNHCEYEIQPKSNESSEDTRQRLS